jgi:glycosyltransferase involved in cell wall biosynthesis
VTVTFAEDGDRSDVVVLGLDRRQHEAIQARRADARALVFYLREQQLVHFLAHPIYDPANALAPAQLARLGALFPLWETRNGARLGEVNELVERLLPDASGHRLLAAEHGLEPSTVPPAGVGGSDDHGGTDVGTTYTITPPARTREEFLDHLRAGRCRAAGLHAETARMTHMVMRLLDRHSGESDERRTRAWRALAGGALGHRDFARLAESFALGDDAEGEERKLPFADPHGLGRELATLRRYMRGELRLAPYLVVQAYLARERLGARTLARRMGKERPRRALSVALLADGLSSVNGVAEVYRELLPRLSGGVAVTPIVCTGTEGIDGVRVARAATLRLPIYPDLDLPLPHLSELAERVVDLDADLIHVTGPGPLGLAGLLVARALRMPLVAGYHTELSDYALALTGDPLLAELARGGTSRFYRGADIVLAPSTLTGARLPALLGLDPDRIAILPQGVDCDRFSPKRRRPGFFGFEPGTAVVLSVGRLSREKGLHLLLRTAALLHRRSDVRFVVVGDGPARSELESAAGANVAFTGWLHGDELAAAFASAELFLFPSATETCGQVLLEAQASGLPCVISPNGSAQEAVEAEVTGVVTTDDSPGGYACSIGMLLDDRPRLQRMGGAARRSALERSWAVSAAALRSAYERVLRAAEQPAAPASAEHLAALPGAVGR